MRSPRSSPHGALRLSAAIGLITLAICRPGFSETLTGVARGKSDAIRVTIEMKAGHAALIDLRYSPVTVLRSRNPIDPPLTEYNGEPGSGYQTQSIRQTYRTHLVLKLSPAAGGLKGRLLATGATLTQSQIVTSFTPDSGAATFTVSSPPTASSKNFRDNSPVTVKERSSGTQSRSWTFADGDLLHGTDAVTIRIFRTGANSPWRITLTTQRTFQSGDVSTPVNSLATGALREKRER